MRHEIVMPQMGESITTGTITKWHKQPGDMIKLDEVLLEISTDKVESEIPSPVAGKVVEIKASEGDTIDIGVLIAVIDDDANASASAAPAKAAAPAPTAPAASAPAAKASAPVSGSERMDVVMPQMGESITTGTITKWHKKPGDMVALDEILLDISTDKVESEIPSPVAGRIEEILYSEGDTVDVGLKIASIEMNTSIPFGASGAQATSAAPAAQASAPAVQSAVSNAPVAEVSGGRRFYTPLVKNLAKKHGVNINDLASLKGSGAAGRVNKEDFMNFLGGKAGTKPASAPVSAATSAPAAAKAPAQTYASGRVEIIPMDNMRKAIAKNMVASKMTSPHVNSIDTVDMTRLVKFRESFKKEFQKQEGYSLTYTHFILYAIVQALKEFPLVNASIDGDNIVIKKDINLGCAVSVSGNGLVVPVIKGADNLNIRGLARSLNTLVEKARAKKLTMDDLTGGTYTFTNNGSFGIMAATPVILQPQLGIFCVGTIKKAPVVTDELTIAIRDIMYATHTYDHRVIDGELGSKFLKHVIGTLETMDPASLF